MKEYRIYRFLRGEFEPKELKIYLVVTFCISTLCMVIAYILYPKESNYTIFTHTLSYLGDYIRNPRGWYYFSIAMIIMGFSFSNFLMYIYNREVLILPWLAKSGIIFAQIGCLGTILVGFFPDVYGDNFLEDVSMGKAHNIVALFAMFGLIIGLTHFGVLFIIDHFPKCRVNKDELYPKPITFPMFLLLVYGGFGMLISQEIVEKKGYPWPGPGLLSFTFWEWSLACIFAAIIYYLALRLPNTIPEVEKRETHQLKSREKR
ncbi:hypothetical protein [Candidatus Lokiarchaeum ossiferum]